MNKINTSNKTANILLLVIDALIVFTSKVAALTSTLTMGIINNESIIINKYLLNFFILYSSYSFTHLTPAPEPNVAPPNVFELLKAFLENAVT